MMEPRLLLLLLWIALLLPSSIASCSPHSCRLLDPCSAADDCAAGLYCGTCPASGKSQPSCTRGQATDPTSIVKGLPFNSYAWLVTHGSSIINESLLLSAVQHEDSKTISKKLCDTVTELASSLLPDDA